VRPDGVTQTLLAGREDGVPGNCIHAQIRKLESERDAARACIAEISNLHRNNGGGCDSCFEEPEDSSDSRHYAEPWPCATVRVIQDHAVPDG
jgi:hypothetical protein